MTMDGLYYTLVEASDREVMTEERRWGDRVNKAEKVGPQRTGKKVVHKESALT